MSQFMFDLEHWKRSWTYTFIYTICSPLINRFIKTWIWLNTSFISSFSFNIILAWNWAESKLCQCMKIQIISKLSQQKSWQQGFWYWKLWCPLCNLCLEYQKYFSTLKTHLLCYKSSWMCSPKILFKFYLFSNSKVV